MSMILDGSNGVTFNDASLQGAAASPYVLKNRIINGAMVIDQRNNGASGTGNLYTVDRWFYYGSQATKGTWQQNAAAVTPPTGYNYYLGFTSSSAYSVLATDQFLFVHKIEGYNASDLAFGTANAKTVTLSFWVRSSLTGTFGGSLRNSAQDRNYPFSYSIPTANTWTQISVTIAGDTTGTWLTTNGIGIEVLFSLGTGTTYSATAGAWTSSGSVSSATGATSVVGTNGATFYITGVQLEIGSTATPFERRMYGQELALCQRYYYKEPSGAAYSPFGTSTQVKQINTNYTLLIKGQVPLRASPTSVDFANLAILPFLGSASLYPVTSCSIDLSSSYVNALTLVSTSSAGSSGALVITLASNSGSGGAYIGLNSEL